MATYRRRGAHAARPAAVPFVAAKRGPPGGADGSAPLTDSNRGSGRKSIRGVRVSGLRTRTSLPKVIAAVLVIGFGAVGFAGGLWSTPSAEPTVQAFLLAWQQQQYQAAAALTTGRPGGGGHGAEGRIPPARRRGLRPGDGPDQPARGHGPGGVQGLGGSRPGRCPVEVRRGPRSAPDRLGVEDRLVPQCDQPRAAQRPAAGGGVQHPAPGVARGRQRRAAADAVRPPTWPG